MSIYLNLLSWCDDIHEVTTRPSVHQRHSEVGADYAPQSVPGRLLLFEKGPPPRFVAQRQELTEQRLAQAVREWELLGESEEERQEMKVASRASHRRPMVQQARLGPEEGVRQDLQVRDR
jgi:hypothetical protein